nr:SGNH/GDSL hydrolase family protein [uncultured Psychroserpens sp.]
MKKTSVILILIAFSVMCCSSSDMNERNIAESNDSTNESTDPPEPDYNILFVGNSLTYYNNLPNLVKAEARQRGLIINTKTLAFGNYAIVDHWADGQVQSLITSNDYDFVVIQQGPSSQQDGYDMLVNGGAEYASLCEANNTKLAYFMVWPSINYYHTFGGVISNYTAGATANNAILCPVGSVWKSYIDQTNDFSYYGPDQFHPSLKGSQVAAKVILESLLNN